MSWCAPVSCGTQFSAMKVLYSTCSLFFVHILLWRSSVAARNLAASASFIGLKFSGLCCVSLALMILILGCPNALCVLTSGTHETTQCKAVDCHGLVTDARQVVARVHL